jgi:hypothetical protein
VLFVRQKPIRGYEMGINLKEGTGKNFMRLIVSFALFFSFISLNSYHEAMDVIRKAMLFTLINK